MIEEIIAGITEALKGRFGEGCAVYTEAVEQSFFTPCFSIACLAQEKKPALGRRSLRRHEFQVLYFPGEGPEPRKECMEAYEGLLQALEIIRAGGDGDALRATGMRGELGEDRLIFTARYDFYVLEAREKAPMMEELDIKELKAKEGAEA